MIEPYTPNILKGKVFCAHCGISLHRQRNKRKTMPDVYLYHCLTNSRVKKGACPGVTMPEHGLLPALKELLKARLPVMLKVYGDALRGEAERTRWMDEMQGSLMRYRTQRQQSYGYIHALYEHLEGGVVSDAEYQGLKAKYDADIAVSAAEISKLEKGIAAFKGQIARYEELRRALGDLNRCHQLSAAHEITLTTCFEGENEQYSEVWRQCVDL